MSRLERVAKLLSDNCYHDVKEIRRAGGSEGIRRVRELRQQGQNIEKVNVGRNDFLYRLVPPQA